MKSRPSQLPLSAPVTALCLCRHWKCCCRLISLYSDGVVACSCACESATASVLHLQHSQPLCECCQCGLHRHSTSLAEILPLRPSPLVLSAETACCKAFKTASRQQCIIQHSIGRDVQNKPANGGNACLHSYSHRWHLGTSPFVYIGEIGDLI